jgi:excisionase family DNA binding protein
VTIKQAAEYCSCTVWAVRQSIGSKGLLACTIGRRRLIDRADLDAFIDARLREAGTMSLVIKSKMPDQMTEGLHTVTKGALDSGTPKPVIIGT